MNSSEQKNYEFTTPTSDEINETIAIIEKKLDSAELENFREGYLEAVVLLTGNRNSYDQISDSLQSDQSRAVAVLAVDYLNGECSREIFVTLDQKNTAK